MRILTIVLVTAVSCCGAWQTVAAQRRPPVSRERMAGLGAAGITESSGVAVSRRHDGVFWTHNDSGDRARLYALDGAGNLLATYRVVGARAVDWEDMAIGPCPGEAISSSCVYIADTGDNQARRDHVTVYVVPEPDPRAGGGERRETSRAHALRLRYEGGPRDAEALAVHPDGTAFLFTKGRHGPILRYALSPALLLQDSAVIAPQDTVPIDPQPMVGRWVTSGAIAPSGNRAVLGTHTELYFFDRSADGWRLSGGSCWLGFPLRQYEATDFLDEETVVVTSEKAGATEGILDWVRCGR